MSFGIYSKFSPYLYCLRWLSNYMTGLDLWKKMGQTEVLLNFGRLLTPRPTRQFVWKMPMVQLLLIWFPIIFLTVHLLTFLLLTLIFRHHCRSRTILLLCVQLISHLLVLWISLKIWGCHLPAALIVPVFQNTKAISFQYLLLIFSQSLAYGIVPRDSCLSKIVPHSRKDDKLDLPSYCPTSWVKSFFPPWPTQLSKGLLVWHPVNLLRTWHSV